jgi:integrase
VGRHANGEGTIYRRKDGRYEAAAYFLTTSGIRKRIRVYGPTRGDVHDKLTEAKSRARQGIPLPDKAWKLGEYLDYWMETIVRPNRRPGTYERAETIIRLYLRPGLGTLPLTYLSVPVVQRFVNQQLSAGQSVSTVETIRKVLSATLTRAQREELVTRNVARLVELPSYKPPETQPWTVDEARRFLRLARSDPLYPAFALLVLYGLRRGEVLGLRWRDVDFTNKLLYIRQQLQRVGGSLRLGDLKTDAGRRDEPLVQLAANVLIEQRARQTAARDAAGDLWDGLGTDEGLVFTTNTGRPIEPRNFYRSFQRICEQHKLRRIRLHGLRHTNATLQMNLGIHDRHIQAVLGHADVTTTRRLYEHSDIGHQREAVEKVEGLFLRVVGTFRCRQLLPSARTLVDVLTSPISGATLGIRTPDPRFTNSTEVDTKSRLTEVNRLIDDRRSQWQLGVIAVSAAVNHGPLLPL